MGNLRRRIVVLAGATVLLVTLASPAAADVHESGTHNCSFGYVPYARSYSTGNTWVTPPGSSLGYYYYNGITWTVRKKHSAEGTSGGFWHVQTDGSLSDPGTYPGCTNAS